MRIAIVGSGIAGLAAAHTLGPDHDVVVFEAADRLGGHANTVTVDDPEVVRTLALIDQPRDAAAPSDDEAKAMLEAYEADPAGIDEALAEVRGALAIEPAALTDEERTGNPVSDNEE